MRVKLGVHPKQKSATRLHAPFIVSAALLLTPRPSASAWVAVRPGPAKSQDKPAGVKTEAVRQFKAGRAAERQGNFHKAAAYERATKIHPNYPQAFTQLGYVQRQLGLHDRAIASYTQALKLNPKFAEAHAYIARAHLATGNMAKAKVHLAALRDLNPKLAEDLAKVVAAAAGWSRSSTSSRAGRVRGGLQPKV